MSKRRITYIHIFIWLFAIFANFANADFSGNMPPQQIISHIIAFIYLMIVFYLFYSVLVPFFLGREMFAAFFGYSFLIVLIMPFFGYTILYFVKAVYEGTFKNFYQGYSVKMHMSGFFPVLTAAVFGSFFRVIVNWYITLNQKAELDKQKLVVELALLKSKLNPHFLFNTLNNIDSLIQKNSDEASAALIRLSDMMRYLTYETSSEFVSLNKEVEYINTFIDLYRIRIITPDDIRIEVEGDLNIMISPALFIPLLENAFKYATFRSGTPSVEIKLSSGKGIIVFEISNYYEKNSNIPGTRQSGYGIVNLKRRLELTYAGKHQLIIEQKDTIYHVKLTIDTNGD